MTLYDDKYMLTTAEISRLTGQTAQNVFQDFKHQEGTKMARGHLRIPPPNVREYLSAKGVDYSHKVIAHINLKGGVGKTISSISAATRAVQYGFNTCILDMDSQGSASLAFGIIPEEDDPIFCDVWQRPADMLTGAIKPLAEYLYLLPSSLENGLLDVQLINPGSQKHAVRGVCDELKTHGFDLIMIDCPPSLGTAVISTICAADIIVIPVSGDAFSLKGLELTFSEIMSICDTFTLDMPVIHILYTKFDKRLKLSRDTFQRLSEEYQEYLISVPIRTSSEYTKALENHTTVFASSRQSIAKEDYDHYVRYLLGIDDMLHHKGGRL